ncbi:MAG: immunity 22 family protein [Pirellulaceae bacterium]
MKCRVHLKTVIAKAKRRGGFREADWVSVWISTVPVQEIPRDYLNLESAEQHRLADGFASEFGLTEYPWDELEFLLEKDGQQFIKWHGSRVERYETGRLSISRHTPLFSYQDEFTEKVRVAAQRLNIEQFSVILLIYNYRYEPCVTGVEAGKPLRFLGVFRLRGELVAKPFDRPDLLQRPEFWALHLAEMLRSPEGDLEAVPTWFGLTDKKISTFVRSLDRYRCRGRSFPIHRIPIAIGSGFTIMIEYLMVPEQSEVHYLLRRADRPDTIRLTVEDTVSPRLAWHDLVALERAARRASEPALPPGATLLALYPTVWLAPSQSPGEVCEELISAWHGLGVAKEEMSGQMAERMVRNGRDSSLPSQSEASLRLTAILRDVLAASPSP